MPSFGTDLTIYNNDGTTILGSILLVDKTDEGSIAYVTDSGIAPNSNGSSGYIYDGPGKWLGISMAPNMTTAEYGPGTQVFFKGSSNVYAVIGTGKNTVSIDLSTLSGYQALANGTYSLRVKAKATGYTDSDLSDSVSITKS